VSGCRRAFSLALLLIVALLPLGGEYWVRVGTLAAIQALAVLGLYVGVGLGRQLNAGQSAFMALGAYGTAYAALKGVPFPWTLGVGLGASLLLGLVAGWVALRASGLYLALATAGLGVILIGVVQNLPALGATDGLAGIPPVVASRIWYPLAFGVLLGGFLLAWGISRSRLGLFIYSLRNEVALEAIGVSPLRIKVLAFLISAFYGGLSGGIFAHWNQVVSPDAFSFDLSILLLVALYLGGASSPVGAVMGGVGLTVLAELLRPLGGAWTGLVFGLAVVAVLVLSPGGLWGKEEACYGRRA